MLTSLKVKEDGVHFPAFGGRCGFCSVWLVLGGSASWMEFDFAEADVKQSEGNQEEVKIGDVEDASIDEGISMDLKRGTAALHGSSMKFQTIQVIIYDGNKA